MGKDRLVEKKKSFLRPRFIIAVKNIAALPSSKKSAKPPNNFLPVHFFNVIASTLKKCLMIVERSSETKLPEKRVFKELG